MLKSIQRFGSKRDRVTVCVQVQSVQFFNKGAVPGRNFIRVEYDNKVDTKCTSYKRIVETTESAFVSFDEPVEFPATVFKDSIGNSMIKSKELSIRQRDRRRSDFTSCVGTASFNLQPIPYNAPTQLNLSIERDGTILDATMNVVVTIRFIDNVHVADVEDSSLISVHCEVSGHECREPLDSSAHAKFETSVDRIQQTFHKNNAWKHLINLACHSDYCGNRVVQANDLVSNKSLSLSLLKLLKMNECSETDDSITVETTEDRRQKQRCSDLLENLVSLLFNELNNTATQLLMAHDEARVLRSDADTWRASTELNIRTLKTKLSSMKAERDGVRCELEVLKGLNAEETICQDSVKASLSNQLVSTIAELQGLTCKYESLQKSSTEEFHALEVTNHLLKGKVRLMKRQRDGALAEGEKLRRALSTWGSIAGSAAELIAESTAETAAEAATSRTASHIVPHFYSNLDVPVRTDVCIHASTDTASPDSSFGTDGDFDADADAEVEASFEAASLTIPPDDDEGQGQGGNSCNTVHAKAVLTGGRVARSELERKIEHLLTQMVEMQKEWTAKYERLEQQNVLLQDLNMRLQVELEQAQRHSQLQLLTSPHQQPPQQTTAITKSPPLDLTTALNDEHLDDLTSNPFTPDLEGFLSRLSPPLSSSRVTYGHSGAGHYGADDYSSSGPDLVLECLGAAKTRFHHQSSALCESASTARRLVAVSSSRREQRREREKYPQQQQQQQTQQQTTGV